MRAWLPPPQKMQTGIFIFLCPRLCANQVQDEGLLAALSSCSRATEASSPPQTLGPQGAGAGADPNSLNFREGLQFGRCVPSCARHITSAGAWPAPGY